MKIMIKQKYVNALAAIIQIVLIFLSNSKHMILSLGGSLGQLMRGIKERL